MATSDYYDSLIDRVNNVADCSQLTALETEILEIFTDALASITVSLDILLPLLTVPGADLGEIVDWIESVIATYSAPHASLLILQTLTLSKQAEAIAALAEKSVEFDCSI